jgi:hypothetical protein
MATNKSLRALLGVGVISVWVLGAALSGAAETLNYKFYTWVIKSESAPVADMEGHTVGFGMRSAFYVFDNGEVATTKHVSTNDLIKGAGPFMQYVTVNFPDGSTITIKSHGTLGGGAGGWTSEILKGTGRFEGIKGTQSAKATYLPAEPGEAGPKGYGEGAILYSAAQMKGCSHEDQDRHRTAGYRRHSGLGERGRCPDGTTSPEGATAERGDGVEFEWRLGCLCRELRFRGAVWNLSHGVENHADRQYRCGYSLEGQPATGYGTSRGSQFAGGVGDEGV